MAEKNSSNTLSKDRRFGTDGIRGPIESTMGPLFTTKLAWAAGCVLKEEGISRVLIGKDTRISGYMLESAMQAGFISAGMNVTLLGPLPTPAVAYLAKSTTQAGVVITASHNTFEDNGIKFFNKDGYKLSSELERKIETKLVEPISVVKAANLGKADRQNDAQGRYIEFCKSSSPDLDLKGLSIVLDCANGASYSIAPKIFSELGAEVNCLSIEPNGININEKCGPTDPSNLQKEVKASGAMLGIAFDGDGDRLLFIDRKGNILDGDDLLYVLINSKQNFLGTSGVVGTLMTNKALELFLTKEDIGFSRADVGDKFVLDELMKQKWILGGEPSGHIICLDSSTTGDAMISALRVLEAIKEQNFDISKVLDSFNKYPQKLINLEINNPQTVMMHQSVRRKVGEMEESLGDKGRVLIRPSGTEHLIRIMVEANSLDFADKAAKELANLISKIG